jgi:hypothetical protein
VGVSKDRQVVRGNDARIDEKGNVLRLTVTKPVSTVVYRLRSGILLSGNSGNKHLEHRTLNDF